VHTDLRRVLIADGENAFLFSLSNYLTFRGCLVDCIDVVEDARALVRHLHYDVVVVGVANDNLATVRLLAQDVRELRPRTRMLALTKDRLSVDETRGIATDVDQVLGRDLPIEQLARFVCSAIAA
jgi:DNA-binding response OmpR family regulator